jgi:GH24 family phage-related lysozyme (muramidase)
MYKSVIQVFPKFSSQLEGNVPYMYQDIKGLVTVGIGFLIEPVILALKLPFYFRDHDGKASEREILLDWRNIKLNRTLKLRGYKEAGKYAKLYLKEVDINDVLKQKMLANEEILKEYFPHWDIFPADAQLGLMSMAWAMGPHFAVKFPKFRDHVNFEYWSEAAKECLMRTTGNPGLIPRNKINKILFENADKVHLEKLNPNRIYGYNG